LIPRKVSSPDVKLLGWLKCTNFDFCSDSAPDPTGELTAHPQLDLKAPSRGWRGTEKGKGRKGEGEERTACRHDLKGRGKDRLCSSKKNMP